jgi:hypothetical protein
MASCEVCKQEMPDEALFCPHCGFSAKLRRSAAETRAPTSTTTLNRRATKLTSSHPSILLFVAAAFKILALIIFVLGTIWISVSIGGAESNGVITVSTANGFEAWVVLETYLMLMCMTIAFFGFVLSLLMQIADNTAR